MSTESAYLTLSAPGAVPDEELPDEESLEGEPLEGEPLAGGAPALVSLPVLDPQAANIAAHMTNPRIKDITFLLLIVCFFICTTSFLKNLDYFA